VEFTGFTTFDFGDASTPAGSPLGPLYYLVTSIDPVNNWLLGSALDQNSLPLIDTLLTHTYAATGDYLAFTDSCCRIDAASPAEKQAVICQAVREAVGCVLRVKPDSLRDDQPLTDLGLDSLMGVEIETSLEAAVGVALPPTSLMRARTIGQIASLIAGHLGGAASVAESTPVSAQTEATSAVDLDAISHEEIERLLGREAESEETKAIEEAKR